MSKSQCTRCKLAVIAAALLAIMSLPLIASAQDSSILLTSLSQAELFLYGRESSGAILTRVAQMERDLFGKEQAGSVLDRIAKVNAFVGESFGEGPSLALKLAAVEWVLLRSTTPEPVILKVDRLEKLVTGKSGEGSIVSRVEQLVKLCLPQGRVSTSKVKVPAGTTLKIRFVTGFSSANAKKGDKISYEVSRDLIIGSEVAIPRGTRGTAAVTSVQPAGRLGRDGKVELDFGSIAAFDGTRLNVGLNESAQKLNESLQFAVGASVAGFVIFGPIGALGGFLVEGKEAAVPAGTEIFVAVTKEAEVTGLTFPGGAEGFAPELPVVQIKPQV